MDEFPVSVKMRTWGQPNAMNPRYGSWFRVLLLGVMAFSVQAELPGFPETSNERLGMRAIRHELLGGFGDARPVEPDSQLLLVNLQMVNQVTADLVFEEGVSESLSLPLSGFQLLWNGQAVAAGADYLVGQPGHLPDPVVLKFSGAKDKGHLVFEVPEGEPATLVLLLQDETIGTLKVDLLGTAPPDEEDPAGTGKLVKYPRLPAPEPPSRHERLAANTRNLMEELVGLPAPVGVTVPHKKLRTLQPGDTVSEKLDGETRRLEYALEINNVQASFLHEIAVVHSKNPLSLELSDEDGNLLWREGPEQQLVVSDLGLPEGIYSLQLTVPKKEEHFHMTVRQSGSRQDGFEFEPNDRHDRVRLPAFARVPEGHWQATGRFIGKDTDCYLLEIPEGNYLATVELHCREIANLNYLVNGVSLAGDRGKTAVVEYLHLTKGRHVFSVEGKDSDYALRAFVTSVPDPFFEEEPNADFGQSKPIVFKQSYRGLISKRNDEDWFRFHLQGARRVRVSARAPEGGLLSVRLFRHGLTCLDQKVVSGEPFDEIVALSRGYYGIQLKSNKMQEEPYSFMIAPVPLASDVEESDQLKLTWGEELRAAAYCSDPQQIHGMLELAGAGRGKIETLTTNHQVTVEAGAPSGNQIPLVLRLKANVPTDEVVEIAVLWTPEGAAKARKSIARLSILPGEAPTTETWEDLPLPEELIGRFNLVALEFNAKPVVPAGLNQGDASRMEKRTLALMDGFNNRGRSFVTSVREPQQSEIALPGNTAWALGGTILRLDSERDLGEGLREFRIEFSMNGRDFTEVFAGELAPHFEEQPFVFGKPVDARFVRLVPVNIQSGKNVGSMALAEWKVIAAHQESPLLMHDIGAEHLGGHIVFENEEKNTRVIAFHDNRCARVESIIWRNDPKHRPDGSKVNPAKVRVSFSTDTPFGPWSELGETSLNPVGETGIRVPAGTWARFVKFEIPLPPEGKQYAGFYPLPGVIEAGPGSILGEWGAYQRKAIYERVTQPTVVVPRLPQGGGANRQDATELMVGQEVTGSVWIDEGRESWFRVIAPAGDINHLACRLSGERYDKAALEAFDRGGRPIEITSIDRGDRSCTRYVPARPGDEILLRVYEPERSYVFLWDDSRSMERYRSRIHAALSSFCEELDPFTERVQLLPFAKSPDGGFLLKDWGAREHEMQAALRGYGRRSSSEAHDNLVEALRLLEPIPGNRAIVIITDADAPEDNGVRAEEWNLLERMRTPIFGFHPLGEARHVDVVQDWADAGGGAYYPIKSLGQLEGAFQQAKAALRRPASFKLLVSGARIKAAPPGKLKISPGPVQRGEITGIGPEDAVEIILDASGSMLKRMGDGRRRIDIAREVLLDFVSRTLPTNTNFALRVFGHREAGSCRTDLEIPLAPLDKRSAVQSIRGINAVNLARTPIGASLEAVSGDLAGVSGRRLVVLITDGKETCEGNPEESVAGLAANGVDFRLNIIGFAIRDPGLKRQFEEWAGIGHGGYFDATDAKGLRDSIEAALLPDFEVEDSGGKIVAAGRVGGEPITLGSGRYKVRIFSKPVRVNEIEILPGEMTSLRMLP